MNRFQTVGISRFQFWLILQICKDAIELTSRQKVRFRRIFFQNEVKKMLCKMVLVLDLLDYIAWINILLNLTNMKIKKTKFVRNAGNLIKNSFKYHAQPQTGAYSCLGYMWLPKSQDRLCKTTAVSRPYRKPSDGIGGSKYNLAWWSWILPRFTGFILSRTGTYSVIKRSRAPAVAVLSYLAREPVDHVPGG